MGVKLARVFPSGALSLLLPFLLAACVPAVKQEWLVQPVTGRVFVAETSAVVAGAQIKSLQLTGSARAQNEAIADAIAVTDERGAFRITGQSQKGIRMLMPGVYLDRRLWLVSHPDCQDAVFLTATLNPAYEEQPSTVAVPVFADMKGDSPEDCPFGEYLLLFGQWLAKTDADEAAKYDYAELVEATRCRNANIRSELDLLLSGFFGDNADKKPADLKTMEPF